MKGKQTPEHKMQLKLALQKMSESHNLDDEKAYEWLSPMIESIDAIPKADNYRVVNWFNMATNSAAVATQLATIWKHQDNPEFKNILKHPGSWKVILLAMRQIEDFHEGVLIKMLDQGTKSQITEAQRAFMQLQTGRPVTKEELQKVLNGNKSPSDNSDLEDIVKDRAPLIQAQISNQAKGLLEYALFVVKDLTQIDDEARLDIFCEELAKVSTGALKAMSPTSAKEIFCTKRYSLLYSNLSKEGYTTAEAKSMLSETARTLEQEFKAVEQLASKWSEISGLPPKKQKTKLLKMLASSISLQNLNVDPKSAIIKASQNIIGVEHTPDEEAMKLLDIIVSKQQEAVSQLHDIKSGNRQDISSAQAKDTDDASLTEQEGIIENSVSSVSSMNNFAISMLQHGFFDDSLHDESFIDTLADTCIEQAKLLSVNGLSSLGFDLPSDGRAWPTKKTISSYQEYQHDTEYQSTISAFRPDIEKLLPLVTEPRIRNQMIRTIQAMSSNKPEHIYDGISELVTNISDQDVLDQKLVSTLLSGGTIKHMANLGLGMAHNDLAIMQNNTLFHETINGKPILQTLEPVVTGMLTTALAHPETHKYLIQIAKEVNNKAHPENQISTLMRPPHNMPQAAVKQYLALSPQAQAKFEASPATTALLRKQVQFQDASSLSMNKAMMEFMQLDVIQQQLNKDEVLDTMTALLPIFMSENMPKEIRIESIAKLKNPKRLLQKMIAIAATKKPITLDYKQEFLQARSSSFIKSKGEYKITDSAFKKNFVPFYRNQEKLFAQCDAIVAELTDHPQQRRALLAMMANNIGLDATSPPSDLKDKIRVTLQDFDLTDKHIENIITTSKKNTAKTTSSSNIDEQSLRAMVSYKNASEAIKTPPAILDLLADHSILEGLEISENEVDILRQHVTNAEKGGATNLAWINFGSETAWPKTKTELDDLKETANTEEPTVLEKVSKDLLKINPLLANGNITRLQKMADTLLSKGPAEIYQQASDLLDVSKDAMEQLAEGDTPKNIAGLMLSVLHNELALGTKPNEALQGNPGEKPVLQQLQPLAAALTKEVFRSDEIRANISKTLAKHSSESSLPKIKALGVSEAEIKTTLADLAKKKPQDQAKYLTDKFKGNKNLKELTTAFKDEAALQKKTNNRLLTSVMFDPKVKAILTNNAEQLSTLLNAFDTPLNAKDIKKMIEELPDGPQDNPFSLLQGVAILRTMSTGKIGKIVSAKVSQKISQSNTVQTMRKSLAGTAARKVLPSFISKSKNKDPSASKLQHCEAKKVDNADHAMKLTHGKVASTQKTDIKQDEENPGSMHM